MLTFAARLEYNMDKRNESFFLRIFFLNLVYCARADL